MATKNTKSSTTKPVLFGLPQAIQVAEGIVTKLKSFGHKASLVIGQTRVSVRVANHKPSSVVGIVPKKTTQVSCPYFTRQDKPSGTDFKVAGSYRILSGQLTGDQVSTMALAALKSGGLLQKQK